MKILIAGCARSGTTLTRHMMRKFEDTVVFPKEISTAHFDKMEGTHLVIKRVWDEHTRLHTLPSDIELIYCVRHPYDVLTSSHEETRHLRPYHVTLQRWTNEYEALMRLREKQPNRDIFYSRYEDMVADPDMTQRRLIDRFGLSPRMRFSEGPEKVFSTSLRKWERDEQLRSYLSGLPPPFVDLLRKFCEEFDYDLPQLS